ncbi:MAG: glutaminyl-peptide cyclotransferase [Mycobacteriaceae bacterium]
MGRPGVVALAAILLTVTACASPAAPTGPAPEQLVVQVVSTRPHDPKAFTEGFEIDHGQLYESTGLEGHSSIRRSDAATGGGQATADLPGKLFGEGLTVAEDTLWQLTWRNGFAIRRDPQTLADRGHVDLGGEGWGVCNQAEAHRLVMSNGTDTLTFRDPVTFAPTGSVTVRMNGSPVTMINELECAGGVVWANIWQTDRIVRIDPANGQVTGVVDAAGLLDRSRYPDADVLNGIAAIPGSDRLLITGKQWPTSFEVRFVPARNAP